jgi:hypothetical protein
MLGSFWVAAQLAASQEGLRSMKLVYLDIEMHTRAIWTVGSKAASSLIEGALLHSCTHARLSDTIEKSFPTFLIKFLLKSHVLASFQRGIAPVAGLNKCWTWGRKSYSTNDNLKAHLTCGGFELLSTPTCTLFVTLRSTVFLIVTPCSLAEA